MRILDVIAYQIRDLRNRRAADTELDEELSAYVEMAVAERVRSGEDEATARRNVLSEMGGVEDVKEKVRDTRRTSSFELVLKDARYALRSLRRAPGFAIVTILTLAVAIGSTAGVFSVVDAVLIRPVPGVQSAHELFTLNRSQDGDTYGNLGLPDFLDYQSGLHSDAVLAAHVGAPVTVTSADGVGTRARADLVTAEYFNVLGVHALRGRLLDQDDGKPGSASVVVLSEDYWRHALSSDDHVIGRTITLDSHQFMIVGVAAAPFRGSAIGSRFDMWAPLSAQPLLLSRMSADIMHDRSAGWLQGFGRRVNGTTIDRIRRDAHLIATQLQSAYPATNAARDAAINADFGLDADERASLRGVLGLLSVSVAFMLTIACINAGGLLLLRARARRREMAARIAIGASRVQLIRQLAVEAFVITGASGAIAVACAAGMAHAVTSLQPAGSVLHGVSVSVDMRMLAIAGALTLLTAGFLTLLPAFGASRLQPILALKDTSPGAGRNNRMQRAAVTIQISLAFALVVTGVLVTNAVLRLLEQPAGFDPESLVMVSVDLSANGYSADRGLPFYRKLIESLQREPAFASASFAKTVPPLDWSDRVSVFVPGTEPPIEKLRENEAAYGFRSQADAIGPSYFSTLRIPLLSGREFSDRDDAHAPPVAIVNESFAKMMWPGINPIGQSISWPPLEGPARPPLTVVGVVADHRYTSLTVAPAPLMYFPVLQNYDGRTTVVVRARGSADAAMRRLAELVSAVDRTVPPGAPTTMQRRMSDSLWQQRTIAIWLVAFGVLAVCITIVGLYGVVSQSVLQRKHEIALRMALGASTARVTGSVLAESLKLGAVGVMIGAPIAFVASGIARNQLTGMVTSDVVAWSTAVVLLPIALVFAGYLPARRITRIQLTDALKSE